MNDTFPTVSVIIPVHNGVRTLPHCLDALLAGVGGVPEILVVDDASTDTTPEIADRYPVRLVRLEENRGPAYARNRGAEAATGRILFFIDSDVKVRPDTVRSVAEFFRDHSAISALMGSYDSEPEAPGFFSQYRNLMHHFVHQHARKEAVTFWCGCGAVRRDVFEALGGFNESFGRPSIEDIELGVRMALAGYQIRLLKTLQVKHLKRWGFLEIIRTDVRDRAIPWTLLIFSGYLHGGGLNLQRRYQLSAVAVCLGFASLVSSPFVHPRLLIVSGLCVVLFLVLNRELHRFFRQGRGLMFSFKALPMVALYYLYSSVAFGIGAFLHFTGRRLT